jgi:hypothetical protein
LPHINRRFKRVSQNTSGNGFDRTMPRLSLLPQTRRKVVG